MSGKYKAPALSEPLHPIRLSHPVERTFREEWITYIQQTRFDVLSGPLMRWDDIPENMDRTLCKLTGGYEVYPHGPMTERDHMVARELMQWLGSPCGFSFITQAFRKAGYDVKEREGKETIVSDQLSVSEIELLKTETPRTDEAFDREHWVGVDDALVDCARELERELNGLKAAVRAYYDNGCGENFVKLCVLAGATVSENVTWPDGQPGKDGG